MNNIIVLLLYYAHVIIRTVVKEAMLLFFNKFRVPQRTHLTRTSLIDPIALKSFFGQIFPQMLRCKKFVKYVMIGCIFCNRKKSRHNLRLKRLTIILASHIPTCPQFVRSAIARQQKPIFVAKTDRFATDECLCGVPAKVLYYLFINDQILCKCSK